MVVYYEFGAHDDYDGEEFEYEIDYDQRIEAVASWMADDYVAHLIRKENASSEQIKKLNGITRKILAKAYAYTLKSFDLMTDDVEDDMRDVIKEYWEEEAYEAYKESKDSDY